MDLAKQKRNFRLWILGGVALGAALSAGALWGLHVACSDNLGWLCQAAQNRPPWALLAALAGVPSAILTWYWRTVVKFESLYHQERGTTGSLAGQSETMHREAELVRQELIALREEKRQLEHETSDLRTQVNAQNAELDRQTSILRTEESVKEEAIRREKQARLDRTNW